MAEVDARRAADPAFGAAAGCGDDRAGSAAFADTGPAKRRFSAADTARHGCQSDACACACAGCRAAGARTRAGTRSRRDAGRSQQGLRAAARMGAAGPEPAGQSADRHGERDVATNDGSNTDAGRGHHCCGATTASADGSRTCGDTGARAASSNGGGRAGASGKSEQGLRAATGVDAARSDAGQCSRRDEGCRCVSSASRTCGR